MTIRAVLRPAALALLVVSCVEAPTRVLAPTLDPAGTVAPRLAVAAELGSVLAGAGAAVADARARIVPTLAPETQAALDAPLGALELALGAGDLLAATNALGSARGALDAVASAGAESPAELSAVGLALDRADAVLAPSPLATTLP